MGGDQVVPDDVRRVRIDKSVKIIPANAFDNRRRLIYVEFHDGIERIGEDAFCYCTSLRGSIKLLGVKIIGNGAFYSCSDLEDIEFGDMLETLGSFAFHNCRSLRSLTMPSVRSIDRGAFHNCVQITDLEFGEGLETLQERAFSNCQRLGRIAMPLDCMIGGDVFSFCPKLTTVDLVGRTHLTVASLHLERWRNDTTEEINRVNQVLPDTEEKTPVVRDWMR
ncbi:leucine-rich repeat domain-containing protein, partial [Skeletonema marinoi]